MKWQDFEFSIDAMANGNQYPLNAENQTWDWAASRIAHGYGSGTIRTGWLQKAPGLMSVATYFLGRTQRGLLDGSGFVIYQPPAEAPQVMSFALCRHEPVAGANAKPGIGWRPAKCRLCDLDISVDSGG